jgi:group I intron endonuclease
MVAIYTLSDPITGEVRYVGKTKSPLSRRLSCHISAKSRSSHCACWISSLVNCGRIPKIELLEEADESSWEEKERFWISYLKFLGTRLTNLDSGGILGKRLHGRTRHEMSQKRKGRTLSLETRNKISLAHKKIEKPWIKRSCAESTRKKISLALIGRKRPDLLGRPVSESTRKKLSEATKKQHRGDSFRAAIRDGIARKKQSPFWQDHCKKLSAAKRSWWDGKDESVRLMFSQRASAAKCAN